MFYLLSVNSVVCSVCVRACTCACVCDFWKRDMFCLFQHMFRQSFLLVTRTDAFGGLSCAGMCENVCAWTHMCVCVSSCLCLYVCLLEQLFSHMFVLLLSMCPFPYVCLSAYKCVACVRVCVCQCVFVSVCVCLVHSQTQYTVYLRLERTEKKKHTSIEASSVLSVTICWFPNQTLWFNEFPVQDTGWEACLLLWLHTASCDAFSYIWHRHYI